MKYIFTAGSFPNLSYTELRLVLETFGYSPDSVKNFSKKIFVVDSKELTDDIVLRIFQRLGGFTRVGREIEDLDKFLLKFDGYSKVVFGISILKEYSSREDIRTIQKLSKQIKKYFVERNIPTRFVLPKKLELNSAQVTKNQILEKGFELVISENKNEKIYSETLAVQDIDGFTQRDMERPYVDVEMGTLPPKLARMMVNFSQVKNNGIIWDPFCGSGTILLESLMSDINVLGSDIDPKAIDYSKGNIEWFAEKGFLQDVKFDLFELDVLHPNGKVVNEIKNTEVDAVVCEPYMGPPQKRFVSEYEAEKLLEDVKELYLGLFEILRKIGHRGFRVVIVLPSYKTKKGWKSLHLNDIVDIHWELENRKHGGELRWYRDTSFISRNIFILEKK